EPVGGLAPRRRGGFDFADQALAHFGEALRRVFERVALAFRYGAALADGGDLGGGAVLAFAPGGALAGDGLKPGIGQLGLAGDCLRFDPYVGADAAFAG